MRGQWIKSTLFFDDMDDVVNVVDVDDVDNVVKDSPGDHLALIYTQARLLPVFDFDPCLPMIVRRKECPGSSLTFPWF